MKKILVLSIVALFTAACNAKSKATETHPTPLIQNKKVAVVYFSATGRTKRVAEKLAQAIHADIHEIKPATTYTDADLNWHNKNSRSSVEMDNKNARPELAADNFSVKGYDVVFLGFPIWWGTAPRIVPSFLEKQDFANKTIVLFATSGSSNLGNTDIELKPSVAPSTKIIKGKTLNNAPTVEELKAWAETFSM